jgi:demethylmenaquinone methyltransferase / 2-methoxy-6-polyprenyl-1,4-benzoquinol methylase
MTAVTGSERTTHARSLFAGIAPEYEWMGALLSFRQDPRWRRSVVRQVAMPPGSLILDVASGTGLVARALARARYRVVRLDPSEQMLRAGGREEPAVLGRAEALPFADESVDALTFTYLLRYVDDPAATMAEMARVVRPGGTVASLEFAVPEEEWALQLWRLYTRRVMPAIGRAVSPAWEYTGGFLGPSIEEHWQRHPIEEQVGWWEAAGIGGLRWRRMSNGAAIVMWGIKT